MDADTEREQFLLGRASGAFVWSFANTIVGRVGTIGIGIALARLLGPTEFGTYAVALIALMAVLSFNELGVSLAIVRWREDPKDIAPTVTTIALGASFVIAGLTYVLAGPFSAAMGEPSATPVVQLLGLTVIISGAVASPAAMMERQFKQHTRMLIDQVERLGRGVDLDRPGGRRLGRHEPCPRAARRRADRGSPVHQVVARALSDRREPSPGDAAAEIRASAGRSQHRGVRRRLCRPDRRRQDARPDRTRLLRTGVQPVPVADHGVFSTAPQRRAGDVRSAAAQTRGDAQRIPRDHRAAGRGRVPGLSAALGRRRAYRRDGLRLRVGSGGRRARVASSPGRVQDPLRARLRLPGRDRRVTGDSGATDRSRCRHWCRR